MKIIIITYYFEPRLGYQEPNLAKELAKLGHDVYVVTSNRMYPPGIIYQSLSRSIGERTTKEGFFIEDGIKVVRLKSGFEVFTRAWLKNLEKTIMELKPDAVQVNEITRFSSFRIAILKWRKRLDFKLIYDAHMVYSVVNKNLLGKIFYFLFRLIIRPLLLREGDIFVAVTEETKVFMNKQCGIPLPMIKVIPLGVNHHLFKFDESIRRELRKQHNISEDDVVFIYAGKIVPAKGPHLLIDTGLRLFDRYKNLKLFFLGDGEQEYINQMKDKMKGNGFDKQVIWHKAVDNKELPKFYSAADVGVWPLQETITTLEASACGLPVIVKDSLSLRDRISNDNGFACKGSVNDLSKYMKRLLIDEELRKRMGKNGRELIEKRMNWQVIARRYIELYIRTANVVKNTIEYVFEK